MLSDTPKALHEVGSAPLVQHALKCGSAISPASIAVVVRDSADPVARFASGLSERGELGSPVHLVEQRERLGTAHAVKLAMPSLAGFKGHVVVIFADTPFIKPDTLKRMVKAAETEKADVMVLGFESRNPGGYGRLIVDKDGNLLRIVEASDATEAELETTLCNSGVICCQSEHLASLVEGVGKSGETGEYYLPAIAQAARLRGLKCAFIECGEEETMGVNTRADLADAERRFQAEKRRHFLESGVSLRSPETVHFAHDTEIGRDAVIEPYVVFGAGVTVETGAEIRSFSHLEGCHVGAGSTVGPFARIRPGAELGNGSKVGNFVEIKNAIIGEDAKASHLSYIGDAEVGESANIGAGAITCNYDGVLKHRTRIGDKAFIGSNASLVAPVAIGDGAVVGAGSTITEDVPDGALSIERSSQQSLPGKGKTLMDSRRAAFEKSGSG